LIFKFTLLNFNLGYHVARKSHQAQMRSLQISELSLHSQQKEDQGKDRAQEILQEMPQTHAAQRVEIAV